MLAFSAGCRGDGIDGERKKSRKEICCRTTRWMDGWTRSTIPGAAARLLRTDGPGTTQNDRRGRALSTRGAGGGGGRQCEERTTTKRREVMGEKGGEGERECVETEEEKEEVQRQRGKCMTSE